MAGDWIKMRASLCTHPKVLLIADIVGESTCIGHRLSTGFSGALNEIVTRDVTRDVTLAALLRVWCATNEHTDDGVWHNSTLKTLDSSAGFPGFGEAMALAGWAIYDEKTGTVTLPNFLENNAPAKDHARSSNAERQARYREKKKGIRDAERDATRGVTGDVTVSVINNAREEKRRDKRKTPIAPKGAVSEPDGFRAFWAAWPASERKGGRDKCLDVWRDKRYEPDAAEIVAHVKAMAATTGWTKERRQFVPAPVVYLRSKAWTGADLAGVEMAGSNSLFDGAL